MLDIININGLNLKFASEELKNDKQFVIEALKNNYLSL